MTDAAMLPTLMNLPPDWLSVVGAVLSPSAGGILYGPWPLALGLGITTLLLEDAALVAAAAMIMHGTISPILAFGAVASGIAAGDVGLYGVGRASRRVGMVTRFLPTQILDRTRNQLQRHLIAAVLVARVVPGLRLATYVGAGALHIPFRPFLSIVLVAVATWTASLLFVGVRLLATLTGFFGLSPWQGVASLIGAVFLVPLLARRFQSGSTTR